MYENLNHEDDPSQVLELATSIAQRSIQEQTWTRSVLGETIPMPPSLPIELMQSIQTGTTVAMLEILENPNITLDVPSRIRNLLDDQAMAYILHICDEEVSQENINSVREQLTVLAEASMSAVANDDRSKQKFKEYLETAKFVASKYSVSVAEVYAEEALYEECTRIVHTPQSYAEEVLEMTNKLNHNFLQAMVKDLVEAMLEAEIARGEITAEEATAQRDEIIREFMQEEESLADINKSLSVLQQAGHKLIVRGIERFWGKQTLEESGTWLNELTDGVDDEVPLSDGLRKQQRFNDIVATLCMEKGWDPNNLTVDQMRYINLSPQMQAFRD